MSLLALAPSEFIEFGVHQDRFFFIRAEDAHHHLETPAAKAA
jgi:hypothetical protein